MKYSGCQCASIGEKHLHSGIIPGHDVVIRENTSVFAPDDAGTATASLSMDLHDTRLDALKDAHECRRKCVGQRKGCLCRIFCCLCHCLPASDREMPGAHIRSCRSSRSCPYLRCPMVICSVCRVLPRITSTGTALPTRSPTRSNWSSSESLIT